MKNLAASCGVSFNGKSFMGAQSPSPRWPFITAANGAVFWLFPHKNASSSQETNMEENISPEIEPEVEPTETAEEAQLLEQKPAAFTLVIQSWATPIIGVVMLIAGLFGGYYLRPVISSDPTPVAAVAGNSTSNTENVPIVPTPDATRSAQQQEMMTAVVERTRHFYGDPNAPVTIIEFSDFQ